jgi:aminopeptidase-like protein|tara:strand:- start:6249 stop:6617 length:369 start_codon:yes stop_codon:yes gene_type:complete
MRSKYGSYKEYHTSLDTLENVVTSEGLHKSFEIYTKIITSLENNKTFKNKLLCEPKLDKYNLYPSLSIKNNKKNKTKIIKNLLSYFDGNLDLISICDKINIPIWEVLEQIDFLKKYKLIEEK